MFNHSLNGVTYSDTSSSSTSSSPNSFPQSPHRLQPLIRPPSQLAMHLPPEVPSTFLPSYYPEGRYASLDHELNGGGGGGSSSAGPSNALFGETLLRSHSPATWEKLSQAGPSTRHLLDGIHINEPHPRTSRDLGPPSYRITPGSIASSILPTSKMASSSASGISTDPLSQSMASTPNTYGTDSPAGGSGGGGGGGNASRYHPYTRDRDTNYGSVSMSSTPSSMSRNNNNYTNTTMPEPTPSSAAYPGNMYGNVPIPERNELESWDRAEGELTSEDYARALDIYSYVMESVPSMRLQHEPIPPGGQRLDNVLDLSSEALSVLTGRSSGVHLAPPDPSPAPSVQKRPGPNGNHGDKKVTKCLGCGATETPEWRRGPMGPRTLCNACGLVHMKLQRKKKKQEEKAAAAAAAAAAKR